MLSQMAIEDLESLAQRGIAPTPREVIRLNGLGLKVECARASGELCALPRVAFLGNLTFREPSIGVNIWLQDAARRFDCKDVETSFILSAFALSHPLESLPPPCDRAAVCAAINSFREKDLAPFTCAQLAAAVSYALYGNDPAALEEPTQKISSADSTPSSLDSLDVSVDAGLVASGVVLRLGSISELSKLTRSKLNAAVVLALDREGAKESDRRHRRATAEYMAELEAIEAAHTNHES